MVRSADTKADVVCYIFDSRTRAFKHCCVGVARRAADERGLRSSDLRVACIRARRILLGEMGGEVGVREGGRRGVDFGRAGRARRVGRGGRAVSKFSTSAPN